MFGCFNLSTPFSKMLVLYVKFISFNQTREQKAIELTKPNRSNLTDSNYVLQTEEQTDFGLHLNLVTNGNGLVFFFFNIFIIFILLPKEELWPFLLRFPIGCFGICFGTQQSSCLVACLSEKSCLRRFKPFCTKFCHSSVCQSLNLTDSRAYCDH